MSLSMKSKNTAFVEEDIALDMCRRKQLFLKFLPNSQENTRAIVSFLVKLQSSSRQICQ